MALPILILSNAQRGAAFATGSGGYRAGGAHRPVAAALALAIAGGIGATLMLALVIPEFTGRPIDPIDTSNIPLPKPDPVVDPVVDRPVIERTVTQVEPRVFLPPIDRSFDFGPVDVDPGPLTIEAGSGSLGGGTVRPVDPPPAPVFRDATRDQRFADRFQPAYPPAMERGEIEGRCPVTVTIAPTGRVTAVSDNGCANDSFFNATRRRALSDWRFRPATRDGVAVESTQDIAVVFEMPRDR